MSDAILSPGALAGATQLGPFGGDNSNDPSSQGPLLIPPKNPGKSKHKSTFAEKLMLVLSSKECANAIRWMPSGVAFCVVDATELVKSVLPKYFKEAKYASFTRKLNRWGFKHLSLPGEQDASIYSHEKFRRDEPQMCKLMDGGHRKQKKIESYLNSMSKNIVGPGGGSSGFGGQSSLLHHGQANVADYMVAASTSGVGMGGGGDHNALYGAGGSLDQFSNRHDMRRTSLGMMPEPLQRPLMESFIGNGSSAGGPSNQRSLLDASSNSNGDNTSPSMLIATAASSLNSASANSSLTREQLRRTSGFQGKAGGTHSDFQLPSSMTAAAIDASERRRPSMPIPTSMPMMSGSLSGNAAGGPGGGAGGPGGGAGGSAAGGASNNFNEDLKQSEAKLAVLEDMIAKERMKHSLLTSIDTQDPPGGVGGISKFGPQYPPV